MKISMKRVHRPLTVVTVLLWLGVLHFGGRFNPFNIPGNFFNETLFCLLIITVVVHFLLWSRKDSLLIAAFTAAVVVGICQLLNVI